MANEWNQFQVSTLIERGALVIGDGYRAKNSELTSSGLPFARVSNINDGFFFNGADCFPEENLHLVGNKVSRPGDVVFTSKGTVGRFGFVRLDTPRFVYSPQLCFWRSLDNQLIDPRFLSFWMSGREFFIQFKGVASQTDMAEYVNLKDQRSMHITLPPLPEQRAIAHILGTLDDKIELNRRMNTTLEAMARALFQSWFVDFGPVRAKAEGRDPGLPQALADLFPDSFVESGLGEIPKGWEVKSAGELFDVAIGKTPPRKEHQWFSTDPNDIRWMSIRDLGNCKVYISQVNEYLTRDAVERFRVRRIPDGTVVLSFKLTVGRVAITDGEMLSNEAIAHFLPRAKVFIGSPYLFCYLHQFDYERLGSTSSIATAVNSDSVRSIPVLVPDLATHESFTHATSPLFFRMKSLQRESRTLAVLRDTLLPKLISGELRVDDVERFVGRYV